MKLFGTLLLMVRRSLRQHALSTAVTVASTALAIALVMAVFNVSQQAERSFTAGDLDVEAVLGARGSEVQLVLNSIYHLETSPGNLPWSLYREVAEDPGVRFAIPYAVGDSYRTFRVVGTTTDVFRDLRFGDGSTLAVRRGHQIFDPRNREAVIGSTVAERTGLKRGDSFNPTHGVGVGADGGVVHDERYLVVGVLEPTGTPLDRVLWIPIEGIFRMGGHKLRGTGEEFEAEAGVDIPDEHKEVSAVLLGFRNRSTGFRLSQLINRQGKIATLAYPVQAVMGDIFNKLGWVNRVLEVIAYLVVAVAAGSILASIYNTMNERRREFAILRALGARRSTVFGAIVLEAGAIAGLGSLVGLVVYLAIGMAVAEIVRSRTGVHLNVLAWHPIFVAAPLGMVALGAASGLLPALKAYKTDVAENLVPQS
ncbi:ABC transporter permease [Engelhardtia mirabilis]|uniref:Outer membrane-specific lipoprotein transporter subunit LolE n=1 Tax=Engelhardtia mirabilis TaxID=2528011 RepID=A0A518BG52_9BACT|nr:outer membrane-specific lipoprotein transporter subunit LolE [Planctomycetes bacterium Pla133]QDV00271.1 outer membrane-specific lipoprotein transporter subunit LolE [Planctomycetes bacterium Pla86]